MFLERNLLRIPARVPSGISADLSGIPPEVHSRTLSDFPSGIPPRSILRNSTKIILVFHLELF